MAESRKNIFDKMGIYNYPVRILGSLLFSLSVIIAQAKLNLSLDIGQMVGVVICLLYPHVFFFRYLKYKTRQVEIQHMALDMLLQGVMAALVNFNPSIILPFLIANSAANFALRGVKQMLKGISLALVAAFIVGFSRHESFVFHVEPIELIAPFLYLVVLTHYMGYFAYSRGIRLKQRHEEAERLSQQDFLTGLNNRRSMFDQVNHIEDRRQKNKDDISVIMIDLDYFKNINDKHGHHHGDAVLIHVGDILKSILRDTDIAARWGGEEFLVLLPKTTLEQGLMIAEKIRKNIEDNHLYYDAITHRITATLGVSSYGNKFDFEQAIQRADQALYKGKKQGRNCVVQLVKD